MRNLQFLALSLLILVGCSHDKDKKKAKQPEPQMTTLTQAYEYGFPLVLMDLSRETLTNVKSAKDGKAPVNQFSAVTKMPDSSTKDARMMKPNRDMMLATAWVDLSNGPQILEVPDTNQRYYVTELIDGWSNVYKSIGKRTTGTTKRRFLIAPPGWQGEAPTGVEVIEAPTALSLVVGHVQIKDKSELKAVNKIQNGFKMYPLTSYGKKFKAPRGKVNQEFNYIPAERIFALSTEEYFNRLNNLMTENAPKAEDKPFIDRFAALNIGPGRTFDMDKLNQSEMAEIQRLPQTMRKKLSSEKMGYGKSVNGWVTIRGTNKFGTDYHKRALAAYSGLAHFHEEDALVSTSVTDSNNERLSGDKTYVIHFAKEQIPETNAFWSITVYNADGKLVKNAMNRYSIGENNKLKMNEDGSLDIYLSTTSPGSNRQSNWLPTPADMYSVTMRMYWPAEKALSPEYALPAIAPVNMPQNLSQAE